MIDYTGIGVADIESSARFYGAALGPHMDKLGQR